MSEVELQQIEVTLPDGSKRSYEKGISALDVASDISGGLARDAVAAVIDGKVVDLSTVINDDCEVRFLKFDDPDGREVYWHSSSHLMAHAVQELFPEAKFGVGPPVDSGFYYDIDIDTQLSEDDLEKIEKKMLELAKADQPYVRKELSKKEALDYFGKKGDEYKLELIDGLDDTKEVISFYTEGDFIDLCTGPHVPSTGKIKYVKLLTVSGSYWRGDENNKQMQRIYGITFPKKKMLEEHLELLEEAKRRDHRKLGKQLELFSIHEEAGPGMIYWHPKGAFIRHQIESFWKEAHLENGYELLYSPHLGKSWLWETSGHLDFYNEAMFSEMKIDEQSYYVKPMNCPFHILMYKSKIHSYRSLPLRWAELGTVYRYEKSGVLHGLLRVRGFTQDDAHIFCTQDQIEDEIYKTVKFAEYMWSAFGFDELKYYVSTKPEKAVGEDSLWEKATKSLMNALERRGVPYELDEGGGAFYGPKIDIKIKDALRREWQMSTIQFDFNLPERFDLNYVGEDGNQHRPFMVHRALLGSIERFFGLLIEHYGGAFPLWLAPEQAVVIPITDDFADYGNAIVEQFKQAGLRIHLDDRSEKVGYKIREAETQKIPYMFIVGAKEKESSTISVRQHKAGDIGTFSPEEFMNRMLEEAKNKINHNK